MIDVLFWSELTSQQASGMTLDDAEFFRADRVRDVSGFISGGARSQVLFGNQVFPFKALRHIDCARFGSRQRTIQIDRAAPKLASVLVDFAVLNFAVNVPAKDFLYRSTEGFLEIRGVDFSDSHIVASSLTGDEQYAIAIDAADGEDMILSNVEKSYVTL